MTNTQQDMAALQIAAAVVEAVAAAGDMGATGGILWAALMDRMSFDQFEQLMLLLVNVEALARHCTYGCCEGRLHQSAALAHRYHATDKGRALVRGAGQVTA